MGRVTHEYRITFYGADEDGTLTRDLFDYVTAYTAEDAITQFKIGHRNVLISNIEPSNYTIKALLDELQFIRDVQASASSGENIGFEDVLDRTIRYIRGDLVVSLHELSTRDRENERAMDIIRRAAKKLEEKSGSK